MPRSVYYLLLFAFLLAACRRSEGIAVIPADDPAFFPGAAAEPVGLPAGTAAAMPGEALAAGALPTAPSYDGTPTPDPALVATGEAAPGMHVVSVGDTLAHLAQRYGTTVEELMVANGLASANLLHAGQQLQIPAPTAVEGPDLKLIPDSELVYGPAAEEFDVMAVAMAYGGALLQYEETVEGVVLRGPAIVQLVADRHSVNPRLLLAALEHRAGWLTNAATAETPYLMGYSQAGQEGLYSQLSWAADQLNLGFYGRREGGLRTIRLNDGTRVAFAAAINDGTAGVQNWLGQHSGATYQGWLQESGPEGFWATFNRLFGNPFGYTVDPLLPADLAQPDFDLPWAGDETWYFTGGPHGGWGNGSAWAALDFVSGEDQLGCYETDAWIRAMAGGVVTRSDLGAVVVDLDGDGYAGTGWAVLYMHLAAEDRVAVGTMVQAGDRLGHPSCEGGFSNGTHVHIARTYNGRWIAADGSIPLVMGGWVSAGTGVEYDGTLGRGELVRYACQCRTEENAINGE